MATQVDPEEHEYSYVNDGYWYTHTTEQYSHYQHLRKDRQPVTKHIGPLEIEDSQAKRDGVDCCKRPPWWVWLLVAIGLVIMAGLTVVIVFQFRPEQNDQGSPTPMTTNAAESTHSVTPKITTPIRTSHVTSTVSPTPTKTLATAPPNTDCQALYTAGYTTSGVYTISPDGVTQMTVYCEQILDGGGWTVFQQRLNGGVTFDQNWTDYRDGFGDASGDLWLGLDNIHALTAGRHQRLKIEMEYPATNLVHVDYSEFHITDGTDKYQLYISGFSTADPISDQLAYHHGTRFSTADQDNDGCECHCAQINSGGWWYNHCNLVKLNGQFNMTGQYVNIRWSRLTPKGVSLISVRMMVKGV